jgi:hypothetical protein
MSENTVVSWAHLTPPRVVTYVRQPRPSLLLVPHLYHPPSRSTSLRPPASHAARRRRAAVRAPAAAPDHTAVREPGRLAADGRVRGLRERGDGGGADARVRGVRGLEVRRVTSTLARRSWMAHRGHRYCRYVIVAARSHGLMCRTLSTRSARSVRLTIGANTRLSARRRRPSSTSVAGNELSRCSVPVCFILLFTIVELLASLELSGIERVVQLPPIGACCQIYLLFSHSVSQYRTMTNTKSTGVQLGNPCSVPSALLSTLSGPSECCMCIVSSLTRSWTCADTLLCSMKCVHRPRYVRDTSRSWAQTSSIPCSYLDSALPSRLFATSLNYSVVDLDGQLLQTRTL